MNPYLLLDIHELQMSMAMYKNDPFILPAKQKYDMKYVLSVVARYYEKEPVDILNKSREEEVKTPRFWAIYFSRRLTSYSLKEVGKYFGGKHHTTVIHVVNFIVDQFDIRDDVSLRVHGALCRDFGINPTEDIEQAKEERFIRNKKTKERKDRHEAWLNEMSYEEPKKINRAPTTYTNIDWSKKYAEAI